MKYLILQFCVVCAVLSYPQLSNNNTTSEKNSYRIPVQEASWILRLSETIHDSTDNGGNVKEEIHDERRNNHYSTVHENDGESNENKENYQVPDVLTAYRRHVEYQNKVRKDTISLRATTEEPVDKCKAKQSCKDGILLPRWKPNDVSTGMIVLRAVVYFLCLSYCFVGIAIISDRFMESIEVITSKEKHINVKSPDGSIKKINVRIWNETVANLTLMALGSSAPEILLSIIELAGNDFEPGDLGPGTIVGSAAFNLFIISAVCVLGLPDGTVKKINFLRVFLLTAFISVFAYVWMYLIISQIGEEGEIALWEGIVTLLMFPITVLVAYGVDKKFCYGAIGKRVMADTQRRFSVMPSRKTSQSDQYLNNHSKPSSGLKDTDIDVQGTEIIEDNAAYIDLLEKRTLEDLKIIREIKQKHPHLDDKDLERMVRQEIQKRKTHSKAFYRKPKSAIKKRLSGAFRDRDSDSDEVSTMKTPGELMAGSEQIIYFEPDEYRVLESCGNAEVVIVRRGGNLQSEVSVDYCTEDGTATAEKDYKPKNGTINFRPGQIQFVLSIPIVDDDIFEEDEYFLVRLTNPRLRNNTDDNVPILGPESTARITILDDDHCGVFEFIESEKMIEENIGLLEIEVVRKTGAHGKAMIEYHTERIDALPGTDYDEANGVLEFADEEVEKVIKIPIIDTDQYQKDVSFNLVLSEPTNDQFNRTRRSTKASIISKAESLLSVKKTDTLLQDLTEEERQVAIQGRPQLGSINTLKINIRENNALHEMVDKLVQEDDSEEAGTETWKEQFQQALKIEAEDDDGEPRKPTCFERFLFYLQLPWKLLFAIVPPSKLLDGWPFGDLASHFGCTVQLKDTINAITFVALGTSLPDTFASMIAAQKEEYADAAIGNITGSNAVNVFLGIGIAWTAAAGYKQKKGEKFIMDPGSIAFSVTIFCIFACIAIGIILLKRLPRFGGGELGGPKVVKYVTGGLLISLWMMYIIISSLKAYCHITGF
ncbi:hypothetical protein SNEBB_004533 [Seison nebaliae]|nr:hypothetical protein SNEBB_004533 [Seison nebaliae]